MNRNRVVDHADAARRGAGVPPASSEPRAGGTPAPRLTALLLAALFAAGCTSQAPVGQGSGTTAGGKEAGDPWQTAAAELRKQTDLGTTRRVLNQLNADLSGKTSVPVPEPKPDEAARRLGQALRLTDEEVREVRTAAYTGLDAAYLADALYLRDAARSLDVSGLPAETRAAVAFAWVCRQVYLHPWQVANPDGTAAYAPPLPPTAVLRRGYGTGLERVYVFLALLQQLGLDGCLVGPPGLEKAGVQRVEDDNTLWKGPFWAAGVLSGADVLLFDPWRGVPFPGPGGKGVGTLGQLKKTPDQVKAWREDKANPWTVPAKDVAEAVAYVTVPLSAVAARNKLLEAQLAAGVGVKLAADPQELTDRFAKATTPVAVWAPPVAEEQFAYTRVLATFLPRSEGGFPPGEHRLQERLDQAEVPQSLIVRPEGLAHPEAQLRLAQEPYAVYQAAVVAPGHRQRIHRGQFHDVSQALVEADKVFAAAEQRSRGDAAQGGEAARAWVEKANAVYRRLSTARRNLRDSPTLPNQEEAQAAEAEVARFWQAERAGAQVLTDRALAAAGRAEVGYLLAVCKHEQAERAQLRYERAAAAPGERAKTIAEQARAAAAAAWDAAKDAWARYAPYAGVQAATFPGRAGHADRLSARAARLAANPAADP